VAQLGARLDGIEEVVGSNPIGSTSLPFFVYILQSESTSRYCIRQTTLFSACSASLCALCDKSLQLSYAFRK
jgi:hypothetical protein